MANAYTAHNIDAFENPHIINCLIGLNVIETIVRQCKWCSFKWTQCFNNEIQPNLVIGCGSPLFWYMVCDQKGDNSFSMLEYNLCCECVEQLAIGNASSNQSSFQLNIYTDTLTNVMYAHMHFIYSVYVDNYPDGEHTLAPFRRNEACTMLNAMYKRKGEKLTLIIN